VFEQAIHALLAGDFICEFRQPALYSFLQDHDQHARVSRWVEEIGYRLSRLGDDGAYFLAYTRVDKDQRAAIRKQFAEIKAEHGPRMQFLMTVQQALGNDLMLTPGSLVDLPSLWERIDKSPKLLEDFRSVLPYLVGSRVSTSHHDNLKRALEGLRRDGYLIEKNPEREIYMVSGKIDYLHQVIAFLLDHEPSVVPEGPSNQLELVADQVAPRADGAPA
jgi:hypothetical protein